MATPREFRGKWTFPGSVYTVSVTFNETLPNTDYQVCLDFDWDPIQWQITGKTVTGFTVSVWQAPPSDKSMSAYIYWDATDFGCPCEGN